MSTPQNGFRRSLDSSPLILEQLSDHELTIILSIERELEVKRVDASKQGKTEKSYLASVQIRSPNVLLLDGARGTGKTSMLLTMAHRWNLHSNCEVERHDYDCEQYRARIDRIRRSQPELDGKIPKQFHPLRILDFDPIPPQMPLIAGIVHAWQPLAATYDESTGFPSDYDYEGETLQDRWEKLFRVAAVGWSSISPAKGLLDQVLDRQEQVHEWQNLGQRWHEFVAEVIRRGKGMPEPHRLAGNPIFVIMIDDVDLQVERIRELLPALRLLYHPNVAFLVAADWDHLVATLRTDFLGQHNRIASLPANSSTTSVEYEKTWTGILANAAATKVFPLKNKWALKRLNLHELLAFPKSVADACESDKADRALPLTMRAILNEWPRRPNDVKLGDYLFRRAGPAEEPHEIPPFITYRDAHQLFERASTQGDGLLGAIEAVRLLISDSDAEAVSFERAVGPEALVEYKADGELAALFRPGYIEETSASSGIEVGASPYFIARRGVFSGGVSMQDNVSANGNCTREMLAITLQDGDYGVVAPALRWNIRLALAWTRVRVTIADAFLNLAFQWRFHEHPDPLRLFAWSREWRLAVLTSLRVFRPVPKRD